MTRPFESDDIDELDAIDAGSEDAPAQATFDEADAGDGFSDDLDAGDSFADAIDAGDVDGVDAAFQGDAAADLGDGFTEGADDMAVWNAFEEEVADALDAADDDEFLGRLLGGLGRAAGVVGRGLGGAARAAGQARGLAQRAGRAAGQVGRVAGAVSPASEAAARLARMLGAPGLAGGLGQIAGAAQSVRRGTGQAQRLARSLGQTAGGAQGLFAQLSQLLGQGFDEIDAFDAVADLYSDDGIDEALPAAVGLAARAAARGLGFRNVAQLSSVARRALVRGVAAAARELARGGAAQNIRALPRLATSAARVAQRRAPTPQGAVQTMRRGLPRAARRVAGNPRLTRRLAQPTPARGPLARPTGVGRGTPRPPLGPGPRTFNFPGPITLTITPR
jgi:hypothetical protein